MSCSLKRENKVITIVGRVKNIPAKKVYLTDAYNWKILLDSADYKNDTFSFHIKPDNFEPYIASISFIDVEGRMKVLLFQNNYLSTSNNKFGYASFILDRGTTSISGSVNTIETEKTDKLQITAGKQMIPYFKTQLSDFGWINTKDKLEREKIINGYKKLINQYPYSFFFVQTLYNYKTLYTKQELVDILALFDTEAQHFNYYQKFATYFKEIPSPGVSLHNYALRDTINQSENIINNLANLNMLIFWASWCGPCKQEIPELKKIYTEFSNKGIRMVSISIDENKEMWRAALTKEQMPWKQLIVDSLLVEKVKISYNFSVIPLVVFTDNKGLEIARFTGYEPGGKDEYTPVIEKYLNKN